MKKYDNPNSLADHIHSLLKHKHIDVPSSSVLGELFDVMYYASMRSEEGQLIQVTVTFYDPNNNEESDSDSDDSLDHCGYTAFSQPIPLDVSSLVKLSKAADSWSSSIAVYLNTTDEKLYMYGLIDQEVHVQSFVNHEIDSRPELIGLFQAAIQGIGVISVTSDYKLLGVLRQNVLIKNFIDVLRFGQISELVERKTQSFTSNISTFLRKRYSLDITDDYEKLILDIWRNSISRILLQIKKYNHGGALVITADDSGLDIKYRMKYKRLRGAMLRFVKMKITEAVVESDIFSKKNLISSELYDEIQDIKSRKIEASNELKGAIRFIASQSCVDGLIVLGDNLFTYGFGAVIGDVAPPKVVYVSETGKYSIEKLKRRSPEDFGTRHRSMMSFCWQNPGSIGVVVSQDGDVRIMSSFEGKLIMWENVRLHKLSRSRMSI